MKIAKDGKRTQEQIILSFVVTFKRGKFELILSSEKYAIMRRHALDKTTK